MNAHGWMRLVLLASFLGSPAQRDARADELQALSRSLRWSHLRLQVAQPEDLEFEVPVDASRIQYAELVYGSPASTRVAIAVIETADGEFMLYADRNRDRRIRERDLVTGSGELRELDLRAEKVDGEFREHFPRQVLFRWTGGQADLLVATATHIDHSVFPDGDETARALNTRQIDGNANGLFADPQDFLQIDLNRDDRFDPFLETFPLRPLMVVRGQRWFVKADPFGQRLRLESATATGRVRIASHPRSDRDAITELIVTLSGEDGSVYSLTGAQATTELPVGRYAAAVLFVAIKAAETGRAWEFTFSRDGGVRAGDWFQVKEGETIEFDPIGKLVWGVEAERSSQQGAASLKLQPRLLTNSGLLINSCRIEGTDSSAGPKCHLSVVDAGDRAIGQSNSGFS